MFEQDRPHRSGRRSRVGHARLALLRLVVLAAILVATQLTPVDAAQPLVADRWSPVGTFRTADGWYATPIHATVLPDGRILFIGTARPKNPPDAARPMRPVSWIFTPPPPGRDPAPSTTIEEIAQPVVYTDTKVGDYTVSDELYCTISVLDADGRVVTSGGTRTVRNADGTLAYTLGLPYQTVLDGSGWRRLPGEMLGSGIFGNRTRWYPTMTRLPDRRLLVTGGMEVVTNEDVGYANRTVETLDSATGARTMFTGRDATPEAIQARDYTHVYVLPYETSLDLLMLGESGTPVYGSTERGTLTATATARPGGGGADAGWGSSSTMLPVRVWNGQWGYKNGSIVVASGKMDTSYSRRADVYDVTGSWRAPIDLTAQRHHPSLVSLPDSRVLVVNGHDPHGDARVQRAQYIDPARSFTTAWGQGSSGVVRGYHAVAVLLPDGRVLVGGGRDQSTDASLEKPTYQIYTPDYVTKTRPRISDVQPEVELGSTFNVISTGPKPAEVQLVALGSSTHSFDGGERSIQLPLGPVTTSPQGAHVAVVGAPANSHVAPPGYYLLYVVDALRVPSAGRIVRIG